MQAGKIRMRGRNMQSARCPARRQRKRKYGCLKRDNVVFAAFCELPVLSGLKPFKALFLKYLARLLDRMIRGNRLFNEW